MYHTYFLHPKGWLEWIGGPDTNNLADKLTNAKQASSIKLLWKKVLLSVVHSCSLKERKLTEAFKPGSRITTVEVSTHRKYTSWCGSLPGTHVKSFHCKWSQELTTALLSWARKDCVYHNSCYANSYITKYQVLETESSDCFFKRGVWSSFSQHVSIFKLEKKM